MHVGGGPRADRQGMQLVKGDTIGGSMDGMSSLLGTTSDIPFVGTYPKYLMGYNRCIPYFC
jgi:hypothetical protein